MSWESGTLWSSSGNERGKTRQLGRPRLNRDPKTPAVARGRDHCRSFAGRGGCDGDPADGDQVAPQGEDLALDVAGGLEHRLLQVLDPLADLVQGREEGVDPLVEDDIEQEPGALLGQLGAGRDPASHHGGGETVLLLEPDTSVLTRAGVIVTICDPACGTGGMLAEARSRPGCTQNYLGSNPLLRRSTAAYIGVLGRRIRSGASHATPEGDFVR